MNWIFGYGSLIWRPGMSFAQRCNASLPDWHRSFAQRSLDHRGTPEHPGRVLTLRKCEGAICDGVAYRIDPSEWLSTLAYLDHRERGGYERQTVLIRVEGSLVEATTYIAPPGNRHDAGSESYEEIAAVVHSAVGPSGSNLEYVSALHSALKTEGIKDAELEALVSAMRTLDASIG